MLNFLWWECRQVGFRCRCIWFGFGVQIDPIELPIKRNSVGPGNMSHCGTPSFDNHLNHYFVVLKYIQQSFLMRKLDVWGNTANIIQNVDHSLRSFVWSVIFVTVNNGLHRSTMGLNRVFQIDDLRFCWTVWNWSLFLTHPTYWYKCMTSKKRTMFHLT